MLYMAFHQNIWSINILCSLGCAHFVLLISYDDGLIKPGEAFTCLFLQAMQYYVYYIII